MAAKKKKVKKPLKKNACYKGYYSWLPQHIIELLPKYRRYSFLHYVTDSPGVTKSLAAPMTTRCVKPPQLHIMINYTSYYPPYWAEYKRGTWADPLRVKRDPLLKNVEMDHTSVAHLDGKNYVMSQQGVLVVVEIIEARATITGVASNRGVPSLNWRFFKEYLVEMDGEIILILFVNCKTIGVVDRVEVYRLMLGEIKWTKAERLGGKVLCLKQQFVWVNSADIGCRGDCIYFTQPSSTGWFVYDMESGSISHV